MPHAELPSPSFNGFHLGPAFIHVCALAYIAGIALAVFLGRRRWARAGETRHWWMRWRYGECPSA
jgi:prolipoprotein diacylglyceryltransferase